VLFEIFKAYRCEFLAFVWLRHRPAPFRVPSNRPAATTDIAIAPSATAQSRIMIRWSLFVIAPPSLGFRQEMVDTAVARSILDIRLQQHILCPSRVRRNR
jgi:hypothetical protein